LRRYQQSEVLAKLFDGAVEGFDGAIGTGDHDAALHNGQDVSGESIGVGALGQAMFHLIDALAYGADPPLKVFGDEFVCGTVFGVDLESEAAERAAILAIGLEDAVAVARQNTKYAFDGLVGLGEGGVDDHGTKGVEIAFKDFAEKSLFAFEEVIEAAGVDVGVGEEVGHAGSGESSFPEEVAGGVDEPVASGKDISHDEKVLDRVSIPIFT
jgi:hypothetical protein